MADLFEVRLRSQAGAYVAVFDRWIEWTITHTVDAPTVYGLHLDGSDSRCALFEHDAQIEFWRFNVALGIGWYKEAEAFHVNPHWWRDAQGKRHFQSTGAGYLDLLARTRILAYAGTSSSHKHGPAETVIKGYVNEQAGPGAGARARPGLTIQADGASGNDINRYLSWMNLLEGCQQIAAIGGGDFDIIGTHAAPQGPASFEFRWYLGQRGTDRTATVTFSEELGNMAEASYQVQRSQVVNHATVGGQGDGTAREIETRQDAPDIALSPWGRRETFVDAREVELGDTAALDEKGDRAIDENRQTAALSFRPVQTPGCSYGVHYYHGDLVTALYNGVSYTKKVQSVTLTNNRSGLSVDVSMSDA